MMRVATSIMATILATALTGCISAPSQPNNAITSTFDQATRLVEARRHYCTTADPYQRAVALALINQLSTAAIPNGGICTDLMGVLSVAPLLSVDVEAAEANRRRFQELTDAGRNTDAPQN